MNINDKGLELIKQMEGFRADPYICPAGVLTVGYGHTGNVTGSVTEEEAEELLKEDVKKAEETIEATVKTPLNENQFSALVSFIYNVGSGAFKSSTLKKHLDAGNFDAAANQFDRWVFAGGRKLPGLIKRRAAEKELFLT